MAKYYSGTYLCSLPLANIFVCCTAANETQKQTEINDVCHKKDLFVYVLFYFISSFLFGIRHGTRMLGYQNIYLIIVFSRF